MENFYFEVIFYIDPNTPNEEECGFLNADSPQHAVSKLYEYYGTDIVQFTLMPLEDGLLVMPKHICEAYLKEKY